MSQAHERNRVNTPERLQQRIRCNARASADFDRFVHALLEPSHEDVALDIGPGLGKQIIPLVTVVRRIVGVDSSPAMVAALRSRVSGPNVDILLGDMDALDQLDLGTFTLAYSVYSLYYSAAPDRVVRAVAQHLDGSRGRFVVVTPDVGNNVEWHADLAHLYELPPAVLEVSRLAREILVPAFREVFRAVECATFRAEVTFSTIDALMQYYDACAPYCRVDRRSEAEDYFRSRLAERGTYRVSKHSLGLTGRP